MTVEKLITQIGELITMEIEDVNRVVHCRSNNEKHAAFVVVMENGKQFDVVVKTR